MPQRIQKPCRAKGCGKLHRNKDGYCEEHRALATGWARSHAGQSASDRGYGTEWQKLRDKILKRDHGMCQNHKRQGIAKAATDVDHIIPKSQGGTDDESNLEALCKACHKQKTARERKGGRVKS